MSYEIEIKEPSKAEFKGMRKPFNKRRKENDTVSDTTFSKVRKPYKRDRNICYEDDLDYFFGGVVELAYTRHLKMPPLL